VSGFEGIVESDDLFFLHSEKGKIYRKPRQRGGKAGKPGISNEQIATCDRSGHKDFKVATQGRVSKKDIDLIEVLCSD
jgi:hypothetical protein